MSFSTKSVSIVIPNWNGANLLRKHLPAVISSSQSAEIVVVDDASTDDSLKLLESEFKKIRVIKKNHNEGYASTVNVGVKEASGEIVILLNTDVEPDKNFLGPLLKHFSDPTVFAVGCLDKSQENDKIILRGRGLAEWWKGFFVHSRGEVDQASTAWVSGGSGAFRKSMWNELGGMDELFNPFYWEDIDLSYRALKSGYKLIFEANSQVNHYHQQGAIKSRYSPFQIKTIAYRNQFIFIWKNLADASIWMEHCIWTPIRLFQAMLTLDFAMIAGYLQACLRLPKIWLSRQMSAKSWRKNDQELNLG